jgi:glutamine synthetase
VKLPRSLEQSLANLGADAVFGRMLGAEFLKLYLAVKRHELSRFRSHITDWERSEYLEIF